MRNSKRHKIRGGSLLALFIATGCQSGTAPVPPTKAEWMQLPCERVKEEYQLAGLAIEGWRNEAEIVDASRPHNDYGKDDMVRSSIEFGALGRLNNLADKIAYANQHRIRAVTIHREKDCPGSITE